VVKKRVKAWALIHSDGCVSTFDTKQEASFHNRFYGRVCPCVIEFDDGKKKKAKVRR